MAAIQRQFLVRPSFFILSTLPEHLTANSFLAGEIVDLNGGKVRSPVSTVGGAWGSGLFPVGMALTDAEGVQDKPHQVVLAQRGNAFGLNKTNSSGSGVGTALTDIGANAALFRTSTRVTTAFIPGGETPYGRIYDFSGDIRQPIGDSGGVVYVSMNSVLL